MWNGEGGEKTRKGDRRGRQGSGVDRTGVASSLANPAEATPVARRCCGQPAREVSWSLRSLPPCPFRPEFTVLQ